MIEFASLLNHDVAELSLTKEKSIVHESWKESSAESVEQLKDYQQEKEKIIGSLSPSSFIWDYSELTNVWENDASDYMEGEITNLWKHNPNMKRWAIIMSENPFVSLKTRLLHKFHPNQKFEIKFFKSSQEAFQWFDQ